MNYGFAFRLSVFAALSKLLRANRSEQTGNLVVDSPHNSIYEEEINGETAIVHRHNAARAYPASRMTQHPIYGKIGQALLFRARTARRPISVSRARALTAASTRPHMARIEHQGLRRARPLGRDPQQRRTLRFGYSTRAPLEVDQLDDRGVDETLRILGEHDIVRPVARLRPFAVLN